MAYLAMVPKCLSKKPCSVTRSSSLEDSSNWSRIQWLGASRGQLGFGIRSRLLE